MNKFLSLFALLTTLCISSPVYASPPPPPMGGQVIKAGPGFHRVGPRHPHMMPPPPPGGAGFVGIRYRRMCYPYRLGWCENSYYPCYGNGIYINLGVPIRF